MSRRRTKGAIRQERPCRRVFTLIELLICIAIIGILASLLMPMLSKARYRSREVVCASNLRQVTALLSLHASDADGQYPTNGGWRTKINALRQGDNMNIRVLLEDSIAVFECPLAAKPHDLQNNPSRSTSPYAMFFNTPGWVGSSPYIGNNSGPNVIQNDINGNPISSTYYSGGHGGLMKKVGDSWCKRNGGDKFNLLASDISVHWSGHPHRFRVTNHHSFRDEYGTTTTDYNHGGVNALYAWLTPDGSYLYPPLAVNFAGDDGHV